MTRTRVLPYHRASSSAKNLSRAIRAKRLLLRGSRYRPRSSDVLINWGNASATARSIADRFLSVGARVLNDPAALNIAGNKLLTFRTLSSTDISEYIPGFTTSRSEAMEWLSNGDTVVVRHDLRGHSGSGIQLVVPDSDNTEIPEASLYVKYIKKLHEYRVHVVLGEVIDTQRKMRRYEVADSAVNWQVRNFRNGFTYGREDVQEDSRRDVLSVNTIAYLGLDFGAVDIIYNQHEDRYYVLEVNTAPGLVGTTLEKYSQKFRTLTS